MAHMDFKCRTNPDIKIRVTIIDDENLVAVTSIRYSRRKGEIHYQYPPLPAKRWWGEHISLIHPRDRTALHKFLGLS
jgi:hypothetical protein